MLTVRRIARPFRLAELPLFSMHSPGQRHARRAANGRSGGSSAHSCYSAQQGDRLSHGSSRRRDRRESRNRACTRPNPNKRIRILGGPARWRSPVGPLASLAVGRLAPLAVGASALRASVGHDKRSLDGWPDLRDLGPRAQRAAYRRRAVSRAPTRAKRAALPRRAAPRPLRTSAASAPLRERSERPTACAKRARGPYRGAKRRGPCAPTASGASPSTRAIRAPLRAGRLYASEASAYRVSCSRE